MSTELTQVRVKQILGSFSFRHRHLVWNSYECHMEESVIFSFYAEKIDMSYGKI